MIFVDDAGHAVFANHVDTITVCAAKRPKPKMAVFCASSHRARDGFHYGATIRAESIAFTVYHVETEAHEVLLAEGRPSESFIDYASHDKLDNFADHIATHGVERNIPEMPLPRMSSARMLPQSIKARLQIKDVSEVAEVA